MFFGYHNILDALKTVDAENFNAEAIYLRLKELEREAIKLTDNSAQKTLSVPPAAEEKWKFIGKIIQQVQQVKHTIIKVIVI